MIFYTIFYDDILQSLQKCLLLKQNPNGESTNTTTG